MKSKEYQNNKKDSCDQCTYTFCTFQGLAIHKKKHVIVNGQNEFAQAEKYNCDKCHYITDRKLQIEIHKKSKEYNNSNQKYSCSKCEYKYCTFQGLLFHEKKHTNVTNVVTDMTNVVTDVTDVTNVVTDVKSVHEGLIFQPSHTVNGGLQSIVTNEITSIRRPVPIETLNNEIAQGGIKSQSTTIVNNVQEGQNISPKKYNCHKCHFITDRRDEIENHKKTNGYFTNQKWSCDQCDYTSCTFQSLSYHKKKHSVFVQNEKSQNIGNSPNETSISKRYNCDRCYYRTDSRSQLVSHKESKEYSIGK